jgi:hypothetical protein
VDPDGPWCPFLNRRRLDLLVRSVSILRERVATRPIADGDGVTHAPGLGRLGGSLLTLGTRHLDPPRQRQDGSGDVAFLRRSRVGGTCAHPQAIHSHKMI